MSEKQLCCSDSAGLAKFYLDFGRRSQSRGCSGYCGGKRPVGRTAATVPVADIRQESSRRLLEFADKMKAIRVVPNIEIITKAGCEVAASVSLARLRSRGTREQVLRFEQQLSCESLRPQVQRLLESLPEN